MRFLIDTQLLIWAAEGASRLPGAAAEMIGDLDNQRLFSSLAIAEVAIKFALGRLTFQYEPSELRRQALANLYEELPLTGLQAGRLATLPPIHKDPFDRLMVAQALAEGVAFVTTDAVLADYPGQIVVV